MKQNTNKLELEQRILRSIAEHPCYNARAHQYARMHVPVAPSCNIQCNYCNRKFDCMNESRPGVTSDVLTPNQALEKFKYVRGKLDNLRVVGIAGPGDPLAEFVNTKETIKLIRDYDPNITACLSTNGLLLPQYAEEIIDMGVKHVTVTMNAVDPKIGKGIYDVVNYNGERFENGTGAEVLMENQIKGIRRIANSGAICKVNIVMIKGINDHHIEDIVKTAKDNGAFITNIMPLIPVQGTPFEQIPATEQEEVHSMRMKCGEIMQQMHHCRQCRADAIGQLDNDVSVEFRNSPCKAEPIKKKEDKAVG